MIPRVLLALGDEKTRRSLLALFKTFAAEILVAENTAALYTYFKLPRGIGLIILDDQWEDLSIETACLMARKDSVRVHSYIIALVDAADARGALLAFSGGADEVIRKPVDPVQFLTACRIGMRLAFLDRRQRLLPETLEQGEEVVRVVHKMEEEHEDVTLKPILMEEDPRPVLAQKMEEALKIAFSELGVAVKDCVNIPDDGMNSSGDFIGWQGVFMPEQVQWQDVIFGLTRPAAQRLCEMVFPHASPEKDENLLRAFTAFLEGVESRCRKLLEKKGNSSASPVFSAPLAIPYSPAVASAGVPVSAQLFRFPNFSMTYDVYTAPTVSRIKPAASAEPGDVLNENLQGKDRVTLASRGLILTEPRLRKIRAEIKPDTTFWIVEPSVFARQMSSRFIK